ncbi:hypothetical protein GCM10010102_08340 [Promicromonospora citrea]|uniref:Uncharacterized protein n=1 Tax=Promicromonospora citrea TaxID=43677 RepID=A0A8H9GEJ6_9MICO|nr:hypothetical protein GCM10010102_08340 [Promicromonospora citrea]
MRDRHRAVLYAQAEGHRPMSGELSDVLARSRRVSHPAWVAACSTAAESCLSASGPVRTPETRVAGIDRGRQVARTTAATFGLTVATIRDSDAGAPGGGLSEPRDDAVESLIVV